tara:strand:- start:8385 stop:9473 length:1089 start_codon:yes stop_codon:yes gene_type:complete
MKKIVIVASGTGGHVVPALTLTDILLKENYSITWIGTKNGIENKLIKNRNINLRYVNSSGIRGKNLLDTIKGLLNFIRSFFQSFIMLIKERPSCVIGFGGYISTSVSLAAYFLRFPVYVHESNSIAGTANRINHFISSKTFETFPNTFKKNHKVMHTGNPIKEGFTQIKSPDIKYHHNEKKCNILIFGGSQGAKFFNDTMPSCLSHFKEMINIKHISGHGNSATVEISYKNYGIESEVIGFSYDIEKFYDWAHLIISRSGSMTLSEIAASGRASILVPYLYSTDNHQYTNAQYLETNNAAVIIQENNEFSNNLHQLLENLVHNKKEMYNMAENAKSLFPQNSSDIILRNIKELNENHNNSAS